MTCLASDVLEPRGMSEATTSPQSEQWRNAANEEYKALMNNNAWLPTRLPEGRKPIGSN